MSFRLLALPCVLEHTLEVPGSQTGLFLYFTEPGGAGVVCWLGDGGGRCFSPLSSGLSTGVHDSTK